MSASSNNDKLDFIDSGGYDSRFFQNRENSNVKKKMSAIDQLQNQNSNSNNNEEPPFSGTGTKF